MSHDDQSADIMDNYWEKILRGCKGPPPEPGLPPKVVYINNGPTVEV